MKTDVVPSARASRVAFAACCFEGRAAHGPVVELRGVAAALAGRIGRRSSVLRHHPLPSERCNTRSCCTVCRANWPEPRRINAGERRADLPRNPLQHRHVLHLRAAKQLGSPHLRVPASFPRERCAFPLRQEPCTAPRARSEAFPPRTSSPPAIERRSHSRTHAAGLGGM
jgi:hypothetical protein